MDCFQLDDGWDDPRTLWQFNRRFPRGLGPLAGAAGRYGAHVGIWISPFGGYGDASRSRLEYGKQQGFEIKDNGFSLAGKRYYARFRALCLTALREGGCNSFKFDGLSAAEGAASRVGEAMLRLIAELREVKPDVYINQTTGTWPSPFWLLHVDSTWRGADDNGFAGAGGKRQQWLTYRDGWTYSLVVAKAPLYPLNSLMNGGVIYARKAPGLSDDPGGDFRAEVRTYFGDGTQLQELYLTPGLLTAANWDDLAAAARWAQRRLSHAPQPGRQAGPDPPGRRIGFRVARRGPAIAEAAQPLRRSADLNGGIRPWKADRLDPRAVRGAGILDRGGAAHGDVAQAEAPAGGRGERLSQAGVSGGGRLIPGTWRWL